MGQRGSPTRSLAHHPRRTPLPSQEYMLLQFFGSPYLTYVHRTIIGIPGIAGIEREFHPGRLAEVVAAERAHLATSLSSQASTSGPVTPSHAARVAGLRRHSSGAF